jgi:hypothetical protein
MPSPDADYITHCRKTPHSLLRLTARIVKNIEGAEAKVGEGLWSKVTEDTDVSDCWVDYPEDKKPRLGIDQTLFDISELGRRGPVQPKHTVQSVPLADMVSRRVYRIFSRDPRMYASDYGCLILPIYVMAVGSGKIAYFDSLGDLCKGAAPKILESEDLSIEVKLPVAEQVAHE